MILHTLRTAKMTETERIYRIARIHGLRPAPIGLDTLTVRILATDEQWSHLLRYLRELGQWSTDVRRQIGGAS